MQGCSYIFIIVTFDNHNYVLSDCCGFLRTEELHVVDSQ